jgi:hypothetical protein
MNISIPSVYTLSRRDQQSITGGGTSSGTPCCVLYSGSSRTVVNNCRCSSYPTPNGTSCKNGIIIVDIIMGYVVIEDAVMY